MRHLRKYQAYLAPCMNKINDATFFYSSLKKTDEGHLKQMREGLRNLFFI